MVAVILKFIISFIAMVILAIVSVLGVILAVYYSLIISSIITGLLGMFNISVYLRGMADAFSSRIKNVYEIIKGGKNG